MMKDEDVVKLVALIKKVEVKTLVSGDKSGRITLETLYPEGTENENQGVVIREIFRFLKKRLSD